MLREFKPISENLLRVAHQEAYSIENMAGHEAEERKTEYIGSNIIGDIVWDYYMDNAGDYWYSKRAIVDGQIVSFEEFLFGHKIKKRRYNVCHE